MSGRRRSSTAESSTVEYRAWQKMKERCFNPRNIRFRHYGGRGITVCDRWIGSYANFLADMGRRPSDGHSVDRVDNDGNYEPGNCRWATWSEQMRNRQNAIREPMRSLMRYMRRRGETCADIAHAFGYSSAGVNIHTKDLYTGWYGRRAPPYSRARKGHSDR